MMYASAFDAVSQGSLTARTGLSIQLRSNFCCLGGRIRSSACNGYQAAREVGISWLPEGHSLVYGSGAMRSRNRYICCATGEQYMHIKPFVTPQAICSHIVLLLAS